MPSTVLREVVTRFRLETNEQDVKHFNLRIGEMKSSLRQLAGLFGVTLGAAGVMAIGKMGYEASRARVNLEYLAGTDFEPLKREIADVQRRMESARAGSSKLFRAEDIENAAAAWVTAFGGPDGLTASTERFGVVLKFAEAQAAITGKSVGEIVSSIQGAIQGGGMSALLEVPGFNAFKKETLEWIDKVTDPKEPGGRTGIEMRAQRIIDTLREQDAAQNKALKSVPEDLLAADKTAAQLKDTLAKLGTVIDKSLTPVLEKLVGVLERLYSWFGKVDDMSSKANVNPMAVVGAKVITSVVPGWDADEAAQMATAKGLSDLGKATADSNRWFGDTTGERWFDTGHRLGWLPSMTPPKPDAEAWETQEPWKSMSREEQERRGRRRRSDEPMVDVGRIIDGVSAIGKSVTAPVARGSDQSGVRPPVSVSVTNHNTFDIKSSDPDGAAREVAKAMDGMVRDARSSALPTEGR